MVAGTMFDSNPSHCKSRGAALLEFAAEFEVNFFLHIINHGGVIQVIILAW